MSLDVRCTLVDDALWPVVSRMRELRSLMLGGTNVTDANGGAAAALHLLPALRQLGLQRTVAGDGALAAAAALPHLETLDLGYSGVSDAGVAQHVAKMTGLRWLSLEQTGVTDFALERLARLVELRHLDLGDTAVSSCGLRALAPLGGLVSLNLSFTDVRCLSPLAPLTGLRSLSLDGEQRVNDAGLAVVSTLPELRDLELYAAAVTDGALLRLARAPAALTLRALDLCCCVAVGDLGVARGVARMPGLEELNLSQTAVSDVGVVAALEGLRRLVGLNLSHTDISQISVQKAQEHATLCRLAVHGCSLDVPPQPRVSVTPAAAAEPLLRIVGP